MPSNRFLAHSLKNRPRLAASVAAALAVALFLPPEFASHGTTRLLAAWNTGTCLFLLLAGLMIARSSRESLLHRARLEDEGEWAVLALVMVAAVASLVAIVAELGIVKQLPEREKAAHVALAGLTVLSSWAFTHTMFAMHYAHNYFLRRENSGDGGLLFPSNPQARKGGRPGKGTDHDHDPDEPDYIDFLYFSFIIGTSAQTADVAFTSKPMRRLGAVHCVLSFLFNTSILALCINIGASLL